MRSFQFWHQHGSLLSVKTDSRRLAPVLPTCSAAVHVLSFLQIEVDANKATNPSFDLEAELSDGDHGYCNVVFVGFFPDEDEYNLLKFYSREFQV